MIQVRELANSTLPASFLMVLPSYCPVCDSPTEITETLSMLSCSNAACGGGIVQRTVAMLAELGVKNLGEAKVQDFLDTYNQTSPYAIIGFIRHYPRIPKLGSKISESFTEGIVQQIRGQQLPNGEYDWSKLTMPLWEFVKLGNLPKIKDSARKLLQNYDSLEKFYADIEERGVTYVQDLLGIQTTSLNKIAATPYRFSQYLFELGVQDEGIRSNIINTMLDYYGSLEQTLDAMQNGQYQHEDIMIANQLVTSAIIQDNFQQPLQNFISLHTKELTSARALAIYKTLLEYKQELLQGVTCFTIQPIKEQSINICISTSVGGGMSKVEFEQLMKKKYNQYIQLNFVKTVTKDCDILICGHLNQATSKLKKAMKMQEEGHRIQILSGEEFDRMLTDEITGGR